MFRELLAAEFAPYGLLSAEQLKKLERHYALLTRWNEKMNLTRISKLEDVIRLHYCESLFLGRSLPEGQLHIADVGSGAGFPGIPVAILRPDCRVDLIESNQRKAMFLKEASRDLPNIRVLAQQATSIKSSYDWTIARAVRLRDVIAAGLSRNVAVLVSDRQAAELSGAVQKIPWGIHRSLVTFHVERDRI
jgi:16S rRNA (guanine(527)-N(7))-methyltransferase RsmG